MEQEGTPLEDVTDHSEIQCEIVTISVSGGAGAGYGVSPPQQLELQTNRQSFHNHREGPYESLLLPGGKCLLYTMHAKQTLIHFK